MTIFLIAVIIVLLICGGYMTNAIMDHIDTGGEDSRSFRVLWTTFWFVMALRGMLLDVRDWSLDKVAELKRLKNKRARKHARAARQVAAKR